ncbi:phosphate regulon sensor histidine kinase PhoR [Aquabacterium sp. OR-4]|uniref:phosphate regulon sensor histidine kinase PhoR n=1 Tax=Aquabacterium sp. OR-4 TaxID=2978127 RepID=UPI0021B24DF8|nr:phosphate regulon sensor histidine kinase PhoR [Aquabacterium sp. OR-4]MDT7836680.1 phosphate regulon sensor histidine kinase PhoR [Aquabacterium sp. OR-4]
MSWLLPRLLVMLASLGLAMLAGHFAGFWLGSSELGTAVGAAAGVTLVVVIDTVRGARLLRWMRSDLALGAPRDAGFWAEVAYRSERAVRERDKAIANEQRKLAEFLQAIEASPNGVVLLDDHDQVSWCNAIAADHLGLDARRDLHQPITNLVRKPAFVAYLQSREWREPLMLAEPSGLSALQLVMRGYGERQTLLITQDVTERQRSDAMRRDFVANVSHEIRTPLTVLAGFVETMASLPLTGVERTRVLALMQQQTVRMQTLVADLLTLAQLEGSPRPAIDRWVSLSGLLERAAADGRTLSAGRHTITVLPVPALELAGQESELFSSVVNLVGNAVRYTPDGGQISVSWQARPDGGGEVLVRDNGIGIAREHLGRLTERFYRVDGSRSRDTGGTGLGLAIVKHVMQRHGGTLEIDSEPGKGSSFRLGLPVGRLRATAAAATLADDATSRVG